MLLTAGNNCKLMRVELYFQIPRSDMKNGLWICYVPYVPYAMHSHNNKYKTTSTVSPFMCDQRTFTGMEQPSTSTKFVVILAQYNTGFETTDKHYECFPECNVGQICTIVHCLEQRRNVKSISIKITCVIFNATGCYHSQPLDARLSKGLENSPYDQ